MGILGKDLLDLHRPLTHTKVQFGADKYWIEENKKGISYGAVLVDLLNYDVTAYWECTQRLHDAVDARDDAQVLRALSDVRTEFLKLPFYNAYLTTLEVAELYLTFPEQVQSLYSNTDVLAPIYHAANDIPTIQDRYARFLTDAMDDGGQRRKKGQRKIPLADRIVMNCMEAFVSGRSLGSDVQADAPNVQMQYAVLQSKEAGIQIVEKMYFDRLSDFVYVELMKGLQKGFLPKRCPNCGRWFLLEPGFDYNYCDNPAPQDPSKLCRDIGATNSFLDKKKNHAIWNVHQRAYRKYYARMKKNHMSRDDFYTWAENAAALRDELLPKYSIANAEERAAMVEEYRLTINIK